MLKEHRHLKIQRRMRIEMALNELNVCYHAEPEDASLGDRWVTSGVVCGQVWTNYPRGHFYSMIIKSQNMHMEGNQTMNIRKSNEQDIERMMEIYAYARRFMAETGNPNQWGPTNWPPEQLIHSDIKNGNSYVCTNDSGEVIGTFYFTQGKDIEPTYRDITDGAWLSDAPYGVVHRIAADGSEKGIGAYCVNWAFDQCGHMRIDTHGDNIVMQKMLKKLGFVHCGTIYVEEDNYPRLAFEKV